MSAPIELRWIERELPVPGGVPGASGVVYLARVLQFREVKGNVDKAGHASGVTWGEWTDVPKVAKGAT